MIALFNKFELPTNKKGVISVEYALCMVIAATIMIGVQALFIRMSVDILNQFTEWVKAFP